MLGVNFAHANWDGTNSLSAINDIFSTQSIFQSWTPLGTANQSDFSGRIIVGYELAADRISLAAELGGTFSKKPQFTENSSKIFFKNVNDAGASTFQTVTGNATSVAAVYSSGAEFDIDIKPGVYVAERKVLLYVRGGLAFNKLTLSDTGQWSSVGNNSQLARAQASANSKSSSNKVGERFGLGLEYRFSKHLRGTLDYTYTDFGKVTTRSSGNNSSLPRNNWVQVAGVDAPTVSVTRQSAMVGLRYDFG